MNYDLYFDNNKKDYTKWSMVEESAVFPDDEDVNKNVKCKYDSDFLTTPRYSANYMSFEGGIEIVSPIIIITTDKIEFLAVKEQLELLFAFLVDPARGNCQIDTKNKGSTHVHMSPIATGPESKLARFTDGEALRICCAAYYWEPVIRTLIPRVRWDKTAVSDIGTLTGFSQSLKWPLPVYRDEKYAYDDKSYLKLTSAELKANLQQLKAYGIADALCSRFFGSNRNAGWNFQSLAGPQSYLGTIECRGPPGSSTWQECLCWIELTTSIVMIARGTGGEIDNLFKYDRSAFGLRKYIKPVRDVRDWDQLSASGLKETLKRHQATRFDFADGGLREAPKDHT